MNVKERKLLEEWKDKYDFNKRQIKKGESLSVGCGNFVSRYSLEELYGLCGLKYNEEANAAKSKPSKKLFIAVKEIIKKYVDTTELNYHLLTTWIIGTYFHEQFETYPLLLFNARKQSGKTRTLKLSSALSCGSDGSVSTSVTETHLFRHLSGAMFFDEFENISSRDKTALRETINAVYKKGNRIVRYKEKKGEYVPEDFFPYYPLALANINGFGDVLSDRALQVILQRSKKKQTKLIEDFSTNPEIRNLKKKLIFLEAKIPRGLFSEWNKFIEQKEYNQELKDLFESISTTNLSGRPLEIFFPLFVVAQVFGVLPVLINCSKDYLVQIEGESLDNIDDLLNDFIEKSDYNGFVNISQILKDFRLTLEEAEEWMNSKWFGRALKRLGFIGRKRLVNGKVQVELNKNTTNTINPIKSTNTTNPIKSTNTTNSTNNNKVDFVELVDKNNNHQKTVFGGIERRGD